MKYTSIGVIGAGVMGTGLAQHLAATGHNVVLIDDDAECRERAPGRITQSLRLEAMFDRALRDSDHSEVLARIVVTDDHSQLAGVDFLIENVTESLSVKQTLYPKLERACREDCVFAANTSAIPIGRLAEALQRPARLIGMHFMNPVPRKAVVEVIPAERTSEATVEAARALLSQMGKRAILVADVPGFVSNRVLMLTINESIHLVQNQVASPADIDEIFVSCFSHKMGPLATADLIGLDTVLLTLEVLHESCSADKYRPCSLLIQMVREGHLGRKSGRGFFDYRR